MHLSSCENSACVPPQNRELSNDDGNDKDDGCKKMDLNFTFEFRNFLELFCKPSVLRPCLQGERVTLARTHLFLFSSLCLQGGQGYPGRRVIPSAC